MYKLHLYGGDKVKEADTIRLYLAICFICGGNMYVLFIF